MPKAWTMKEKFFLKRQLKDFYLNQNKGIKEIGRLLLISEKTVFKRLKTFGIPANYKLKRRRDIIIPKHRTEDLAEFFGIMLGDGHVANYQIVVSLGSKEKEYAFYVADLIGGIFGVPGKISERASGYRDVYLGSVQLVEWLRLEGLVNNKVRFQVGAPSWLSSNKKFARKFLRGFFDTDGTIYKLRWGAQVAFTNESVPLLNSTRNMLLYLGYSPSRVAGSKVYLTRKKDLARFLSEIGTKNPKHLARFREFLK